MNCGSKMADVQAQAPMRARDFKESLKGLVQCSKSRIDFLTSVARQNIMAAAIIVKLIEEHFQKVPGKIKLHVLYLVDSILKNVGEDYIALFNLVSMFCDFFFKADKGTKLKMVELRRTWQNVLPAEKLYEIDCRMSALDPGWPDFSKYSKNKTHSGLLTEQQQNVASVPKPVTATSSDLHSLCEGVAEILYSKFLTGRKESNSDQMAPSCYVPSKECKLEVHKVEAMQESSMCIPSTTASVPVIPTSVAQPLPGQEMIKVEPVSSTPESAKPQRCAKEEDPGLATSLASASSSPTTEVQLTPALAYCRKTIKRFLSLKYYDLAEPFSKPVSKLCPYLKDYHKEIKEPMDLSTIKSKLENGQYKNSKEFAQDVELMFSNCFKFNYERDPVYHKGVELQRIFRKRFSKCPADPPEPESDVEIIEISDTSSDSEDSDGEGRETPLMSQKQGSRSSTGNKRRASASFRKQRKRVRCLDSSDSESDSEQSRDEPAHSAGGPPAPIPPQGAPEPHCSKSSSDCYDSDSDVEIVEIIHLSTNSDSAGEQKPEVPLTSQQQVSVKVEPDAERLMESINRKTCRPTTLLRGENLVEFFSRVFQQADCSTRYELIKLRQSWSGALSIEKLLELDKRILEIEPNCWFLLGEFE